MAMPTTRRRTTTKLLRLHPEELARITARAEACGLKAARFIREAALGATHKARHGTETDRFLRGLARIGRSLERVAQLAPRNLGTTFGKHIAAAVHAHRALIKEVIGDSQPAHRSRR
jgi:hypothetical protein